MDCSFSRLQFTSDLLPSDVTGVAIYDEHVREFVFKPGPILPTRPGGRDQRATPRPVALLEVMDRAKVTIDGEATPSATIHGLARRIRWTTRAPFRCPKPDDRFLMRIRGISPDADELEILRARRYV